MKTNFGPFAPDIAEANLSDLLAFYYDSTPARTVANLLGRAGEYTLTTEIEYQGDWRSRERTLKNGLDDLLTCYTVVEVAALAGFIQAGSGSNFWKEAKVVLNHRLVRDYCAEHSPMSLPLLLRWRLMGTRITLRNTFDYAAQMIAFLDLDRRFCQLERGVLLRMLDSGKIGGLGFADLLMLVRDTHAFARSLLLDPLEQSAVDQAAAELGVFLQFCSDLSDLFSSLPVVPLLRSAMWDRYSYWFDWGDAELTAQMSAVCGAFSDWRSTTHDPDAKVEIDNYVVRTEAAIRALTEKSNRRVVRNLLRELDRRDGTIDEDVWVDVRVDYTHGIKELHEEPPTESAESTLAGPTARRFNTTLVGASDRGSGTIVVGAPNRRFKTSLAGAPVRRFNTTRWSLVLSSASDLEKDVGARHALSKLCQIYWRPIFTFIHRRGFSAEDAQDLTQDFFVMIMDGKLLRHADASRGRFRSLLLKALKNFLIDASERRNVERRRQTGTLVSWEDWMVEAPSTHSFPTRQVESWSPERFFDVRWAATIVEQALRRLREDCEARGRLRVFNVLSSSLALESSDISYEGLGETLGVSDTQVKRLIYQLRRRYRDLLRREVSATVERPETVDEELRYLCATLATDEYEGRRRQSDPPGRRESTTEIGGLSDSRFRTATCPRCGAAARVEGGKCLSCLLPVGLEKDVAGGESFEAVVKETGIRDTAWRFGNYQVLEEIGRGHMGVIYRARQRHSRRIVALKRVLSYLKGSPDTLERFRRETEAAAGLDHPNILPIYEIGEVDALPFFTMKYATGGTLQSVASSLREDPRQCIMLLAKVARAIDYAHRQGILHRDLKPENILLDSRGEPMVSDFGLAKRLDAGNDATPGLIFGTPGFIAPEQASGNRDALTAAVDVYSLGAVLFDLLTGRPPFVGTHALAVIRQAADEQAPSLRSINPSLDSRLEMICAKCLKREPQERYHSAAELAEDLERWLQTLS